MLISVTDDKVTSIINDLSSDQFPTPSPASSIFPSLFSPPSSPYPFYNLLSTCLSQSCHSTSIHQGHHSASQYQYSLSTSMQPPPLQPRPPSVNFGPCKSIDQITTRYLQEKDTGRLAVHLTTEYFFEEKIMTESTIGTLDQTRLLRIKAIVLAKFAARRSAADSEALWTKCKIATGQKCIKGLRRRRLQQSGLQ